MRKGIAFMAVISYFAVLALFLGVLSSEAIDILEIIAHPLSLTPWENFAIHTASIITNSQNTIAKSVDEFATADAAYKTFLMWRIVGSSLITLIVIWVIYRVLKKFVRSTQYDLGTWLLIILLSFLSVWIIGLIASFLSGQGMPSFFGFYNGWIELIVKRDVLIQYLIKSITP